MRVWLVSPAWRRYSVTRVALAERRWLCGELEAMGHEAHGVIVADDDNLDVAREYGFDTVERPNHDLGAKFNAGWQYAADRGAEIFVHIGSDDWVHPRAFQVLDELDLSLAPYPEFTPGAPQVWRRAPMVVAQRSCTLVNMAQATALRCRVAGRHGVIPWLIPRVVMESAGFQPVEPGQQRGIDGALVRGLPKRPNWVFQDMPDDTLVDFKSGVNITRYEELAHNLGVAEPTGLDVLARSYPQHLVDMAQDACDQLVAA